MADWTFDVFTALHDDIKDHGISGKHVKRVRITLSAAAFPKWADASATAACVAVATNGGMPIKVLTCI